MALLASHHTAASSVLGVRDGSDPKVTGCAADAITTDQVDVYDPPEHLTDILQLRSSARCGISWARFVPNAALKAKPTLTLEIESSGPPIWSSQPPVCWHHVHG